MRRVHAEWRAEVDKRERQGSELRTVKMIKGRKRINGNQEEDKRCGGG